jgi:hypothetical protein
VFADSGQVSADAVGSQVRHVGQCKLDVVRQCIDAVAMKQLRRNGAIPDGREPPTHIDDVVVHAEGFLQHDHGPAHRSSRNHLIGRNRPI